MPKIRRRPNPAISGDKLVADFLMAMTNLSTAATAKQVARQTERDTLRAIDSLAGQNAYLPTANLTPAVQADLMRSSVSAHVQKAQAEQISAFTGQQLDALEAVAKRNYIGRKLRVRVLQPDFKPLESYWWNKHTGQYSQGFIRFGRLAGIIEDLSLAKNLIVLRPTAAARLIIPDRKFIVVYIINPQTLTPVVDLVL